ncbi:MAG: hypothetical protein EAS52_17980 [Parapedobacter sp.]|nr:MAG: hypothetical protein EAS52_17980 [Parapedobacter sp.]
MSDFDRFQQEVINAYLEKKEKRLLPSELERASPALLMNYCLTLFYRGELADDLPTLNRIFNPLAKYADLETAIKKFGTARFKSLQYFIIGKTLTPREPIVKLLAVLIDFQPRPYDRWVRERNGNKGENVGGKADEQNTNEVPPKDNLAQNGIKDTAQEGDNEHKETPPSEEQTIKPSILSRLKKSALYGTIAFAGMAGAYQISDSFDRECMYWKTDRYVPIACNEKIEDAEIIPLDKEAVKNFRKIMSPDTLTLKSVGKVWYAKPTQDSAEFYTTKGVYPMDKGKALKPATEYIIKKYILDRYK